MKEDFKSRYFRGQGKLFLAPRAAGGGADGLEFIGDLSSVEMTPSVERFTTRENISGQGHVGATGVRSVEYGVSIVMRSIQPKHLAQAIGGTVTTAASASVTDEEHTARLGKFIHLEHVKVSNVVVTDDGGVETFTVGDDYVVHAEEGMIELVDGGAIVEGENIEVDYDHANQHQIVADPGNVDLVAVFAGINTADNDKQTRAELYRLQVDPSSLPMITDETAEMTISGLLLRDSDRADGDQLFRWVTED